MRVIRTDTDESGLISRLQCHKHGQGWCQEPKGVCKGAEEQLSASWAPSAGGKDLDWLEENCWPRDEPFTSSAGARLGQNKSCHSICPCVWMQKVIQRSTRFPEGTLLQPTALGRVVQTVSPLDAATHCLQVQGTVCTWERRWCAAEESLKMHHRATVLSWEGVTVHEAGWTHPADRRYQDPSSHLQTFSVAKLLLPGKLLKSLPWASPH